VAAGARRRPRRRRAAARRPDRTPRAHRRARQHATARRSGRLAREKLMDYRKKLAVKPGAKVRLKAIDPAFHGSHDSEASAKAELAREVARLTELQYRLYAERRHALLVVLQGIDAAGKDGTVWHVLSAM